MNEQDPNARGPNETSDDELADVLTTISVLAKRLAAKLRQPRQPEKGGNVNELE